MINTNKLKGRLKEKDKLQSDLAKAIGCSTPTCCQKINNRRAMTLEEAEKAAVFLGVSSDEFGEFFFA